ncbi:hypothetical protein GCM10010172_67800 [Paractinoplanes ferrugineus]
MAGDGAQDGERDDDPGARSQHRAAERHHERLGGQGATQLAAGQADGPQQGVLARTFQDREGQRVGDADQGDQHGQDEQAGHHGEGLGERLVEFRHVVVVVVDLHGGKRPGDAVEGGPDVGGGGTGGRVDLYLAQAVSGPGPAGRPYLRLRSRSYPAYT